MSAIVNQLRPPIITSYYGKGTHCVVTSIDDGVATILIDDNDTDAPIPQYTFQFPVTWLPIGVKVNDALAFRFVYDSDERAAEVVYEVNRGK